MNLEMVKISQVPKSIKIATISKIRGIYLGYENIF